MARGRRVVFTSTDISDNAGFPLFLSLEIARFPRIFPSLFLRFHQDILVKNIYSF